MKKMISVILILVLIMSFASCRKANEGTSSNASSIDDIETSMPQNSTKDDIQVSAPQNTAENETQLPSQNEEIVYQSTIDTPKEIIFYKGGKFGVSTNKKLNLNVAKCVESWYKNYENDTLPLTKTAVSEEMIAKLKQSETVVEICFNYDQEIKFCGKIELERTTRILIPLTGSQAYYVFRGNDAYSYQNGLHNVKGSGLEKYFDGISLDKEVRKWESTVIAPKKVTFYKDGMQSVSTDKEFNHKIARHIEAWFQYKDSIAVASLYATTDLINKNRRNETAIELQFDGEIKFYGGVINQKTRTLFIPLTGDDDNLIFHNSTDAPDDWTGPFVAGGGLEKFFDKVQFTPLTEENTKPAESVFDTENIICITFYGYYGYGTGVDVPNENMAEVIKWLGTFTFGEKASDVPPLGTNTHIIVIEYANGTVIKEGLDVIAVNGVSYKLNHGEFPDCYWELITKSELPR